MTLPMPMSAPPTNLFNMPIKLISLFGFGTRLVRPPQMAPKSKATNKNNLGKKSTAAFFWRDQSESH